MTQMTDNTIEKILEQMGKTYRSWKPRQERVETTWNFLVRELSSASQELALLEAGRPEAAVAAPLAQLETQFLSGMAGRLLTGFSSLFHVRALRPVLAVLVIVLFGAGSLLKVASASLPGDALYTIKLVREQAQVQLTRDETERAKLAVAFAITRADEVKRVVAREEPRERKAAHLSLATARLEAHVAQATERLAVLSEKKELAAVVEEGAEQIVSLLSEAQEAAIAGNGAVASEVTRALFSVNETRELVGFVEQPPSAMVQSVPAEVRIAAAPSMQIKEESRPAVHPTIVKEKRMSSQPKALTNSARSISSLPFAESVASDVEESLPIAVSVGSAI